MFISKIDIKEFRGIKECNKPLELSKFTVLIGRNNSGKSSILEALSLFPNPNSSTPPYRATRHSVVRELHHSDLSLIYGYSGKARISYTIKDIKSNPLRIEITETGKRNVYFVEGTQKVIPGDLASFLNIDKPIDKVTFFIPNDTRFMKKMEDIEEIDRNLMMKSKAHIRAVKLVNECTDDKYTEVLLNLPSLQVRKELTDNVYYIYLRDLGDGIEKAIIIILWMEALQPYILLWDDFGSTFHPSLIKALLKYLGEKDIQVVLSTHSIDVLYELSEIKPKDATVLQLYKNSDDILYYKKFNMEELEDIIDANIDPRSLIDALKL